MTSITFIDKTGAARAIDAAEGRSLMDVAVENGIQGIVGECGGALLCATCHVYVETVPANASLGERGDMEEDMLDLAQAEVKPSSRLCCQIVVKPELDGLVVRVPAV